MGCALPACSSWNVQLSAAAAGGMECSAVETEQLAGGA